MTVALGHFASDFAALGPTMLYPILAVSLGMSYGMIGLAALAWAVTTSVIQPLFGYLGDRVGRRWIASLSPAWIAVWVTMAAFAPSYTVLVVYLVVAAVGVAAFHPQGAAVANEAQAGNTGTNVALFFLGGHAAFAVGPLILGAVLAAGGPAWMPVVLAPVLVVSLYMARSLRGFRAPPKAPIRVEVGRARLWRHLGGACGVAAGRYRPRLGLRQSRNLYPRVRVARPTRPTARGHRAFRASARTRRGRVRRRRLHRPFRRAPDPGLLIARDDSRAAGVQPPAVRSLAHFPWAP